MYANETYVNEIQLRRLNCGFAKTFRAEAFFFLFSPKDVKVDVVGFESHVIR